MVVTSKMNSASLPSARPDSEQLVDLHVYLVPPDVWNDKYQSAYNEVINETISIGFVRVWPELSIWNLREELRNQLGPTSLPEEFVYVRSVGRCLTQVKGRQETKMKVKAFLPPMNFAPEIFILESEQDVSDMEVEEEESMEEKGVASRKEKKVAFRGTANSNLTAKTKFPSGNLKGPKAIVSVKSNGKPALASKSNTTKTKGPERSKTGQTMTMTELKALQKRETELKKPRSNKILPRVGKASVGKGPAVHNHAKGGTTSKRSEISNGKQVKGKQTAIGSLKSIVSQKPGKPSNLKWKQQENKKSGTRSHVTFTRGKDGKKPYPYKQGQRSMLSKEYRPDNISALQAPPTVSHKAHPSNQYPSLPLLQPHNNQPPVALPSPSPHPPSNANAYPVHPQVSTPVALPHSVMSHAKNPSESYVSPRRQPSQSRMFGSSSSVSLKRQEMDTSSNHRVISPKESDNSLYSSAKRQSSHEQQSSQRTYSQTTEETLPGFSSMSESQHSETSPPYNSVILPDKKSILRESTPLAENDSTKEHIDIGQVSDLEREPQLTTPSASQGLSKLQSPRKEARQDTFTKNTNSDSGLGEQTPEDTQERILRGSEGPQIFERSDDSFRQGHHDNQYETASKSKPFVGADEGQGQYNFYQEDSPRSYQQNPNFPSRTQREDGGPQPHPVHRDQRGYYGDRGPQGGQSAMHPVHGTYQDLSPRGRNYEQTGRPADSLSNQEKFFTPRTQRDEGVVQDSSYNPHISGGTTSRYSDNMRNQQGHPYDYDNSRGPIDQANDTQEAMAFLQLSNAGTVTHDNEQLRYGSPSDLASEKPMNPDKQRFLHLIRKEQQGRLEMEKMREELIKKAKLLQGKTIDRRKKARDYWKKRYYDEKKKTPSLEEHVAKLASQVQHQNRKLMNHLEGKGTKGPKGPPSKRMDHKIQIFKHQHDMEDLKRQVDNARMKLVTEIKLRTQAETELRVLKSEVTQKKINVTLKRGKQLQAIQKSEDKSKGKTPLPRGAEGSSI